MKTHALILCLILLASNLIAQVPLCTDFHFAKNFKTDLNGDGKKDNIILIDTKETGKFTLKVNNKAIDGKLSAEIDGFIVVDIDTTDKYKEIAVHTPGESDDDEYLVYWYDGKEIKEMGYLTRWPDFKGDGTIIVGDWMGFWTKWDKYVLDAESRKIILVPQEIYAVNEEGTVREPFSIYKSKSETEIVEILIPSTRIQILTCAFSGGNYLSDWYLIRTSNNLIGWARLESFYDKVDGLHWAD
ncbi:MAG: hypothetical protein ABIL39_03400 [candidate division WOR-3 bacterium]